MTLTKLLDYLPRGNLLDDQAWRKRHVFLMWVLGLHVPALLLFGLWLGDTPAFVLAVLSVPAVFVLVASQVHHRRVASFFVTAGLTWCSVTLVVFSEGSIEAHFHFFIIVGFIALYQDWVPFLWNIVFTTLSHGIGSAWQAGLIFNHLPAQNNPWLWSVIHGVSVLAACVGVVVFWRETENEQQKTLVLRTELANAEITQRKFTSDLLVNLARRNQSMLYRQLDIIGQLEEKERDPDALAELFRLDHLATRIRRNAESLLVLSGEEPTRVWSEPVRLIDVVRAAIAETEDLDRVAFAVDERMEVLGHLVTDLTHVLAELTENAVRFSPPEANVTIRTRPYMRKPGAAVLTVEDWGVGMRPEDMAAANDILTNPRDVDLSVSQRLGLHVVARLAARHHIQVSLTATPGCGVTAAVVLPPELFAEGPRGRSGTAGLGPIGNGGPAHDRSVAPASPTGTAPPIGTPSPGGPGHSSPGIPVGSTAAQSSHPDIPMPRRAPGRPGGDGTRHAAPHPAPEQAPPPPARGAPTGTNGTHPAHGASYGGTSYGGTHGGSYGNGDPHRDGASTAPAAGGAPRAPAADGPPPRNGQRGVHATPPRGDQASGGGHEDESEWTGWWTPVRLPTVDAESWEDEHPVYATAHRSQQDPHHGWTPPPGEAPALPAGPSRSRSSDTPTGPVITARTAPGAGHGQGSDHTGARGGTTDTAGNGSDQLDPRLSRRVPQASLAPELRRETSTDDEAVIPEPAAPPDAERTRNALSRFQASRQAAQQEVGEDDTGHGNSGGSNGYDNGHHGWRRS